MKEKEYIIATNRVKITSAINSLRDVLPGDDYGIPYDDFSLTVGKLRQIEDRLFTMVDVVVEQEEEE